MQRRELLCWTGAAGTLALAGCLAEGPDTGGQDGTGPADGTPTPEPEDQPAESTNGENGSGESTPDADPSETVVEFFDTLAEGDVDEINAYVHEDGPFEQLSEDEVGDTENTSFELSNLETVERTDESATVEFDFTVHYMDDERGMRRQQIELRAADGEWKVWALEDRTSELVPSVNFDVGHEDDALEIVHEGGDAVVADRLSIDGEGLESTGGWRELGGTVSGDDGTVVAGDSLTVGVEREYQLSIVWTDPEREATVTLQSMAGASGSESESDGEPAPPAVREHLQDAPNFDGTLADRTGEDGVTVLTGDPGDGAEYRFLPPAIRVDPGTTVTWEVADGTVHTVTATDESFDSGVFDGEDETWSHTFEESGVFLYYCAPHRSLGQKGAVVVGDA